MLVGQEMIRAQVALSSSMVAGRLMLAIENACASSSSAFHVGWLAVAAGSVDMALVVGAEKISSDDRGVVAKALATALDVERSTVDSSSATPFMDIYAVEARRYLERTDATAREFAEVAAKNARNGSRNPLAQHRVPLSVDDVLAARMIVDPLTRPMCSSIGDGVAAVVLCGSDVARSKRLDGPAVLASVIESGTVDGNDAVVRAAGRAYEEAGVAPDDIDVAEMHDAELRDAAAPAELIISEELGFAEHGAGARLVRGGLSQLSGTKPLKPSGGLLARGHPIGATGTAQIFELVQQLRGRAGDRQVRARIALAENAGGCLGGGPVVCAITILAAT